ncbi:MAG: hypothetical protein KBF88_07955 [Polyangiaceae bacterium]|nr:hypothetical protein [Polyangiaceae bacterium]
MTPNKDPSAALSQETDQVLADLHTICGEFESLNIETLSVGSELTDALFGPSVAEDAPVSYCFNPA